MGADLYLEAQHFRPRRTLIRLNKAGRWVIYRDHFYSGYVAVRDTHKDTPEVRRVFRSLGFEKVKHDPTQGGPR